MLMCGLTIGASLVVWRGHARTAYAYHKITNGSYPNELQQHFGKPRREFEASMLGLPDDGICDEWTNKVSWRIIVCWGTQPESQPQG